MDRSGRRWVIIIGFAVGALVAAMLWMGRGVPDQRAESNPPAPPAAAVPPPPPPRRVIETVAGMPPVVDPDNLYSETRADQLSPAVGGALPRVYVPNRQSNDVYVIDPVEMKVVGRFRVGINPQHVVPSWDLKTLWVTNNAEGRTDGTLTPIDPMTGKPGKSIPVDDPYNMYFTPDGRSAVVVAEARKRLDFRDPQTMAMQSSLAVPECAGINHADFSIDGRYAIFTCEFKGMLAKIDFVDRKVLGYLKLSRGGMPQDIRASPDGKVFYVADMHADGVHVIDGDAFVEAGFIETGPGTHGLYPSRDGTKLYVANRGSHKVYGPPARQGQRLRHRLRDAQGRGDVAGPRRGQPRHGECERRREGAVAVRPVRRRRLRFRHDHGRSAQHQGGQGAARPHGVAAAGPLLARPHRESAVARAVRALVARTTDAPRLEDKACSTTLTITRTGRTRITTRGPRCASRRPRSRPDRRSSGPARCIRRSSAMRRATARSAAWRSSRAPSPSTRSRTST